MVGPRSVRLFPVFHPAAALYTPSNVDVLRQDFRALPELLALGAPEQPPVAGGARPRGRAAGRGGAGRARAG